LISLENIKATKEINILQETEAKIILHNPDAIKSIQKNSIFGKSNYEEYCAKKKQWTNINK
jgi:hypothetical protein